MTYVVGRPKIYNEDLFKTRVNLILETNSFTNNGVYVSELENHYKKLTGSAHAIAVSNATAGLELTLESLVPYDTKKKLRVAVPSYTFVATASCARRFGHELVFIDSDFDFNIDVEDLLANHKNEPIDVVIIPELFGNRLNYDVSYLRGEYGIQIIWDRAHALGIPASNGLAQIYSQHATKIAGAFELGVVTTDNPQLAEYLRSARNFGFDLTTVDEPNVIFTGTNSKTSEIAAAAALTQLEHLNEIKTHYQNIYYRYVEELKSVGQCRVFIQNIPDSNYSYVILFAKAKKKLKEFLEMRNIHVKEYFRPIHLYSEYQTTDILPCAETLYKSTIALPTGLTIDEMDVKFICDQIKEFYNYI